MPENKTLDFDATGEENTRKFMRAFFETAREAQGPKHNEFKRMYRMYKLQKDMSNRDPNRSNIFIPKWFSMVETVTPAMVDALIGLRPYIPMEIEGDPSGDIGAALTDVTDAFLEDGDFDWHTMRLIKYVVSFGTGFIEGRPDWVKRTIQEERPIFSTDYYGRSVQVGMDYEDMERYFLRLILRAYAPWEIYKDPLAKSLEPHECRGIIKFRGLTSKRQLKKMAEMGQLPDFDIEKLQSDMEGLKDDDWGRQLAESCGVPTPRYDDDMGVWLSFESADRYIDMWNFTTILRDGPNPYEHGETNLTRVVNVDDPNPYSEWFGIGDGRPVEQLCYALNDNWDQTFDNHHMQNQGIIYYDTDAMNVDQLVMIAGNRVPVSPQPNQRIEDAVHERKTPGLNRAHYMIPQTLNTLIDRTMGQFNSQRGEESGGDQTAREALMLKSAGDSRTKLKIKMLEKMGLKRFGEKAAAIIDQFAAPDDIVAKIGVERAILLPSVNPASLGSGHKMVFKGSDRLANLQIQRQDAKDIYQLTAGNPSINQEWLGNWLLEKFDVPEYERRKAVRNDEQAMQVQAALAEMGGGGGAESTRGISNGRTMGGAIGYSPTGRDQNEKLGAAI